MTELFITGMRRRKKDLVYVILVTLIVTFFMSGLLMIRNILESYLLEKNRSSYGEWVIASPADDLSHPYLGEKGSLSYILKPCTDQEGTPGAGGLIGFVSEELRAIGRITFYEGRYPEKDDEIASDLFSLQTLGYSYELGQTITVYRTVKNEEGVQEVAGKDYTLVGTVKPFAQMWNKGAGLNYPNFLVTEGALSAYQEEIKTGWFYRMDPSAAKADPQEFFEGFSESHQGDPLLFNASLYGVSLFGDSGSSLVTGLIILFAVFAVSFVLASYTDRRRQAYYRLRTLGCTRQKLDLIIAAECGIAAMVPAVSGLALAYFLGFIVCRIIAGSVGLNGFFAFDPGIFVSQILAILGSILISVLLTMLRMRDRRLRPASTALTPKDMKKLRASMKRLEKHADDPFLRQRVIHRKISLASALFTFAVLAFLLFCGTKIFKAAAQYRSLQREPDFTLTVMDPDELYIHAGDLVAEDGDRIESGSEDGMKVAVLNPYYGPDEKELEFLRSLPGVTRVEGSVKDLWHLASWEGIRQRPDLRNTGLQIDGKQYLIEPEMTNTAVNIVKDYSQLANVGRRNGRSFTKEELDAIRRGEYAVIMFGDVYYNFINDKGPEEIPEELLTPHEGDEIRIFSRTDEEGIRIPVLRIIKDPDYHGGFFSEFQTDIITLFISENTAEKLRLHEPSAPEFKNNFFRFYFGPGASFDATDRVLASFTARHPKSEYFNYAESKRASLRSDVLRPLLIYGSLLLMTILVYMILLRSMTEIRARRNFESCRKLRLLGMTERKFSLRLLRAEAREALPVFAGFAAGSLFLFVQRLIDNMKLRKSPEFVGRISMKTGDIISDPAQMTADWFLYEAGIPVLFVFTLLLFVGITVFGWKVSRKTYETEGIL